MKFSIENVLLMNFQYGVIDVLESTRRYSLIID